MTNIEHELRRLLDVKGQEVADQVSATPRLLRRVRRARLVIPTAVIAMASASVLAFTSFPFTRNLDRIPMPAEMDGDAQPLRKSYFVGDTPFWIAGGTEGLWVAGFRISFINFEMNMSTSSPKLDALPSGATYGMGRFWVAVDKKDAGDRLLSARLEEGDPTGARRVEVLDEGPIEDRGHDKHFMAVGHGYVWMTTGDAHVQRYHPVTKQLETFDLRSELRGYQGEQNALEVAAGERYMWFANAGGRVAAFDPTSMEPAGPEFDLSKPGEDLNWQIGGLQFSDGRLVILRSSARGVQQIWQMNEVNEQMEEPIRLGRFAPLGGPNVENASAYLLRSHTERKAIIYRIDLGTGTRFQRKATLGQTYMGFTVINGSGWVSDFEKREVRRVPLPGG
ncbi:MAG TPA: hypothetical protein VE174_00485 [Actinomycetota bacterium]|nr:hypothetical protein [Actinomycetota bacterium]